jgi:mRNA interferase RelE/StbE
MLLGPYQLYPKRANSISEANLLALRKLRIALPSAPLKIKFTPRAAEELDRLNVDVANRIVNKISWLAEHPYARVERLIGMPDHLDGLLKYRIGAYRVLFWFEEDAIVVYRVGHRSKIYKDL